MMSSIGLPRAFITIMDHLTVLFERNGLVGIAMDMEDGNADLGEGIEAVDGVVLGEDFFHLLLGEAVLLRGAGMDCHRWTRREPGGEEMRKI
jgi:hypothetical protein